MCASCGPECLHAVPCHALLPCASCWYDPAQHTPCTLHSAGLGKDDVEGPGMRVLQTQPLDEVH